MTGTSRRALWAAVLVACLGAAAGADFLVLRRDWMPTTCAGGGCEAHYPNSFAVRALQLSSDASPVGQTGCKGMGRLKKEKLEAAGLFRDHLECAWQNHAADLKSLQTSWWESWEEYGRCTPATSAVTYLALGLQLDQAYPLPQDLPAAVDGTRLADAVAAAFGAKPFIQCDGPALKSVLICFDPDSTAAPDGPTMVDCPWAPVTACGGELVVPRANQGAATCTSYFTASPVALQGLSLPAGTPVAAMATAGGNGGTADATNPLAKAAQEDAAATPTPAPAAAASTDGAAGGTVAGRSIDGTQPSEGSDQSSGGEATRGGEATSGGGTSGQASGGSGGANQASSEQAANDAGGTITDASGSTTSTDSGGTTTGSMGAALGGGIAVGIVLGLAVFGMAYIIWNWRRRAAHTVANVPAADPEKGACQVSTSGGSVSSWSSSGGEKRPTNGLSGPPSSSAGGCAATLLARLDSSNSLPRRQDSQHNMQSTLYCQTSGISASSAPSSPSRVYCQPSAPRSSSGRLCRQDRSGGSGSGRFYSQPSGSGSSGANTPNCSPSKLQHTISVGSSSRCPGRLFSQPGVDSGTAAATAAVGENAAVDNPLWTGGTLSTPSSQCWTENPLSELDAEPANTSEAAAVEAGARRQGSFVARSKSPSTLASHRLPAVSE